MMGYSSISWLSESDIQNIQIIYIKFGCKLLPLDLGQKLFPSNLQKIDVIILA